MPITGDMGVLFRAAAGPRVGFGHLARCRALARALGVRPIVSLRGSAGTARAAGALGVRVAPRGVTALARPGLRLLVVDDPDARAARIWVAAARRRGVPVAVVRDASPRALGADLVIDGSVRTHADERPGRCLGPRFAVLDPRLPAIRARRRAPRRGPIVVALGGGAHVFPHVGAVVRALASRVPAADIRVAPGFTARVRPTLPGARWVPPARLAAALAAARVAIVAGGLTAQEACALGVPAVAVAVVPAQRPAIRAMAARGAVVDAGSLGARGSAARVADAAARLLTTPSARRRMAVAGRGLVDGRGAARVAAALVALAAGGGAHA
ncbi:MAG: hypothetical protein R2745_05930 [Vicinamibacterales bacterium]